MEPRPATLLSIDLYNRLLELPYAETAEIGRIAWRLRTARLRAPNDPVLAIAHLQALIMIGNAEEALALAELVWSQRHALDQQATLTFGALLKDLGLFDRSLDLLRLKFIFAQSAEPELKSVALDCALWLGDLDLARSLTEEFGVSDSRVAAFTTEIRRSHFAPYFAAYQRVVREALFGRQTACFADLIPVEGAVELVNMAFIRADRNERRRLEGEIDASLDDYYQASGQSIGAHLPFINTVILDTTAHWSDLGNRRASAEAEAISRPGE